MAAEQTTKPVISGIKPPDKLVLGSNPVENWKLFKQRWNTYVLLSRLENLDKKFQVALFLHTLDDEALRIQNGFQYATDDDNRTLQEIINKFDEFVIGEQNETYERFKFNQRSQSQGETFDTFLADLRSLSKTCNFCHECRDSLIRDKIVTGINDHQTRTDLLKERHLTLEKCIDICRSAEDAATQGKVFQDSKTADIDAIRYRKQTSAASAKSQQSGVRPHAPTDRMKQNTSSCLFCGYTNHPRSQCPARGARCNICDKVGHYQKVCRSGRKTDFRQSRYRNRSSVQNEVTEIQSDIDSDAESFLGEVYELTTKDEDWTVAIHLDEDLHPFKLDTGASVTVMSERDLKTTPRELRKPDKILRAAGGKDLEVKGFTEKTLRYKDRSIVEKIYIVTGQKHSLLSRQACVKLGLIKRIDELEEQKPNFKEEFPDLFKGLGKLKEQYTIKLRDDVEPLHIFTPRKIAHPLMPKVKEQLENMLRQGVISQVTEPTDWCAGMVVVPKQNGSIRICVDLTSLNKAVKREVHPLRSVDENLAQFSGSKIFTKLDATSGFWQIPLSEESRKYTTFLTPFGRYCMNRLPFGISSASEVFQRTMAEILKNLEGVVCHIDDIIIHAPDQATHDKRVRDTMRCLQDAGLTLNEKCTFSKNSLKFLGHIIDPSGIHVDPDKVKSITNFPPPQNVTELQRFLGMVNQMTKFAPGLAVTTKPLRSLLRKDSEWAWDHSQESAFKAIKQQLTVAPVLAHYSPKLKTIIAADASKNGLGAVLIQVQPNDSRKPVCFISRTLTETEKRYAVIEKEALAVTWASERLSEYVLGLRYTIETDHKPLIPLLTSKELSKLPPRILRFRLRLAKFDPEVIHVSGKSQITADALSRAPTDDPSVADICFYKEIQAMGDQIISSLPASSRKITEIIAHQRADPEISEVRKYCDNGWPNYMPANTLLKQYWSNQHHFTIVNDLLIFNDRIVIPRELRMDTLSRLHESHLGITKCRALAQNSVWWPNISGEIEDMIKKCTVCAKLKPDTREPLLPSVFPDRPWSRVAADLFHLKGKTYLAVTDYYSRWPELRMLEDLSSMCVINKMKSILATHGIPDVVVSDNGPQFSSTQFQKFARNYEFTHVTSSPRYPQSNGMIERAIQTLKNMLKKAEDPYIALLNYRATPLFNKFSPSELLMGRKLQTKLPIMEQKLLPQLLNKTSLQERENKHRDNMCRQYNTRHRANKHLPELIPGDNVFIKDMGRNAKVIKQHHNPRSYIVQPENSASPLRRNCKSLVPVVLPRQRENTPMQHPEQAPAAPASEESPPVPEQVPQQLNSPAATRVSSFGRTIKPPRRLDW